MSASEQTITNAPAELSPFQVAVATHQESFDALHEEELARLKMIDAVGKSLHKQWRSSRRLKTGEYAPAPATTSDVQWIAEHDGITEIDVANSVWEELPEDIKKESLKTAQIAVDAVNYNAIFYTEETSDLMNAVARYMHSNWSHRHGIAFVPFEQLDQQRSASYIRLAQIAVEAHGDRRWATRHEMIDRALDVQEENPERYLQLQDELPLAAMAPGEACRFRTGQPVLIETENTTLFGAPPTPHVLALREGRVVAVPSEVVEIPEDASETIVEARMLYDGLVFTAKAYEVALLPTIVQRHLLSQVAQRGYGSASELMRCQDAYEIAKLVDGDMQKLSQLQNGDWNGVIAQIFGQDFAHLMSTRYSTTQGWTRVLALAQTLITTPEVSQPAPTTPAPQPPSNITGSEPSTQRDIKPVKAPFQRTLRKTDTEQAPAPVAPTAPVPTTPVVQPPIPVAAEPVTPAAPEPVVPPAQAPAQPTQVATPVQPLASSMDVDPEEVELVKARIRADKRKARNSAAARKKEGKKPLRRAFPAFKDEDADHVIVAVATGGDEIKLLDLSEMTTKREILQHYGIKFHARFEPILNTDDFDEVIKKAMALSKQL